MSSIVIEKTTLSPSELRAVAQYLETLEANAGATIEAPDGTETYCLVEYVVLKIGGNKGRVKLEWDDGCWCLTELLPETEVSS